MPLLHSSTAPLLPREWLRLKREQQGLRQRDVATRLAALGPHAAVSQSQLSKLERGQSSFTGLGFFQLEGLRQVLNIAQAEWDERMQSTSALIHRKRSP